MNNKKNNILRSEKWKQDRFMRIALYIAVFGILLFIALAITLPTKQ